MNETKTNRVKVLRALADALENLPNLPVMPDIDALRDDVIGIRFQLTSDGAKAPENAAHILRDFPAQFQSRDDDGTYLEWHGEFAGVDVKMAMLRSDAYTRRVPQPPVAGELHPALAGAL